MGKARDGSRARLWGSFSFEKFLNAIVCYMKHCRLGYHAPRPPGYAPGHGPSLHSLSGFEFD